MFFVVARFICGARRYRVTAPSPVQALPPVLHWCYECFRVILASETFAKRVSARIGCFMPGGRVRWLFDRLPFEKTCALYSSINAVVLLLYSRFVCVVE